MPITSTVYCCAKAYKHNLCSQQLMCLLEADARVFFISLNALTADERWHQWRWRRVVQLQLVPTFLTVSSPSSLVFPPNPP